MTRLPRIGISACFMHADPQRPLFKGKTLLYIEQSLAHWAMAREVMAYMIPTTESAAIRQAFIDDIDGLILHGGADVAPSSYGEEPIADKWPGDAVRDAYELDLLRRCIERDKPVLGVCRGAQVINVGQGGTLYQDLATQRPQSQEHRDWQVYDQLFHEICFASGSRLQDLYGGVDGGRINSVHHQGIKDLGKDLEVEAWAPDGTVEAIRLRSSPGAERYVSGVQWHPEFQDRNQKDLLDPLVPLDDFLQAVKQRL